MITGSTYLERGRPVVATCQWNGTRNPDLADLQARFPLITTRKSGPRNVMVRRADGTEVVRPFRGLAKPKDGT